MAHHCFSIYARNTAYCYNAVCCGDEPVTVQD